MDDINLQPSKGPSDALNFEFTDTNDEIFCVSCCCHILQIKCVVVDDCTFRYCCGAAVRAALSLCGPAGSLGFA